MSDVAFPASVMAERLELRCYLEADVENIAALIDSNRRHLLQNFPELSRGLATLTGAEAFLSNCATQWHERKGYCYGVFTKTPAALIGQVKVKNIQWEILGAELSYFIGQSFLRHGYAAEAVAAVVEVAFRDLGFNRLYARIIPSNIASLRLAQKLGMQFEGVHRNGFRCGLGRLHDVHCYALVRDDYVSRTAEVADSTH